MIEKEKKKKKRKEENEIEKARKREENNVNRKTTILENVQTNQFVSRCSNIYSNKPAQFIVYRVREREREREREKLNNLQLIGTVRIQPSANWMNFSLSSLPLFRPQGTKIKVKVKAKKKKV